MGWGSPFEAVHKILDPRLIKPLKAIGRIEVQYPAPHRGFWPCTGFLVRSDTVITCGHCVQDQSVCDRTSIEFFDERGESILKSQCQKFVTDGGVYSDFAVFKILDVSNYPLTPLQLADQKAFVGQNVFLAGYPVFANRERTLARCQVQPTWPLQSSDTLYDCNSGGGHSGSPVLDEQTQRVVSIHCSSNKQRFVGRGANAALLRSALPNSVP